MILAGLACASALKIGVAPMAGARAGAVSMAADIVGTAATLQGPEIFWGPDGVPLGHDESDIKGYDNFGKFVEAVKSAGLDKTLSGAGPYTVFAPSDQAFEDFQGTVTEDILKYHVVEGKITSDAISGDLKTLQGGSLKYDRRFRKTFLDGAMVGNKSAGPSKSQNWPCDVECSNGVIHSIDKVLAPGAYTGE